MRSVLEGILILEIDVAGLHSADAGEQKLKNPKSSPRAWKRFWGEMAAAVIAVTPTGGAGKLARNTTESRTGRRSCAPRTKNSCSSPPTIARSPG